MLAWLFSPSEGYSRFVSFLRTANGRLFLVGVLSASITGASILGAQDIRRRTARKRLRDAIEDELGPKGHATKDSLDNVGIVRRNGDDDENDRILVDESLVREQLTRNYAFLGEEGMKGIRSAFVVVVGMGGVGSAAATMLVRSGVGRIRIIDFDQVTLSSLNRHATATLADVGTPKVAAAKRYFRKIAPFVAVDARNELFSLTAAPNLLAGDPDFVLDAIDNITSKVQLLKYCHEHNIRVLSSMGSAGKVDATRLQIGDISMTSEDPLARAVRRRLRIEGVATGVPCVFSSERQALAGKLLPLPEDEYLKGNVGELSTLEAFRVRILPVLGPIPSVCGTIMASHVITTLGGLPSAPLAFKVRAKMYTRMWQDLSKLEARLTGSNKIGLNEEDVAYLFEDMHQGRSVVAPTHVVPQKPMLCRWRRDEPLCWENIVLFEREEGMRHQREVLFAPHRRDPDAVWGDATADVVAARQAEERATRHWRL